MNSQWSDEVFDAFLQEVVTGQHPPDLTARITDAWQRQRAGELPLPTGTNTASALVAPPVAAASAGNRNVSKQRTERLNRRTSLTWSAVLFVAASTILLVASLQWRNLVPAVIEKASSSVASSTNNVVAPKQIDDEKPLLNKPPGNLGEILPLNEVPFASQEPIQADSKAQFRGSNRPLTKLDDQQIVDLIDTQFIELWKQLDVVPAERVSEEELAQSLSRTLTGQELSAYELAQLNLLDAVARRKKVLAGALDSNAFARRWADKFVNQWLRSGSLGLNSEPVKRLSQFIANGISNDSPWSDLISRAVAGDAMAGDAFASALAGGNNHRFASTISDQLLDTSLACSRCHDSTTAGNLVQSQDEYWSLVALLSGIDVRTSEGSNLREVVDKQKILFAASKKEPSLFFERRDGTLEAAKFNLPDGRPWQSIEGSHTPRAALAKWLAQSPQADRATVDQVWRFAFGRPLVGSNSLINDVGLAERDDLLELMAQQFRVHGRNLSQLVGWVIQSDAFSRSEIAFDQSRWLQATDAEISQWHEAEMTFAAKTTLGQQSPGNGLEGSLAAALKWNRSPSSNVGVLAQPNFNSKAKPNAQVKSDVVMPAASYAIHRGRVSLTQQTFLDNLLVSSKLSWKEKVEHIVALSPGFSANSRVVQLTEELAQESKDPRRALLELLWAVQNADAS